MDEQDILTDAELKEVIEGMEAQMDWDCYVPDVQWYKKNIDKIWRLALEIERRRVRETYKVYVWDGILKNYGDGMAFAYATSVKEAREAIVVRYNGRVEDLEKYHIWLEHKALNDGWTPDWDWDYELWNDLEAEPQVFTGPVARAIDGSD